MISLTNCINFKNRNTIITDFLVTIFIINDDNNIQFKRKGEYEEGFEEQGIEGDTITFVILLYPHTFYFYSFFLHLLLLSVDSKIGIMITSKKVL